MPETTKKVLLLVEDNAVLAALYKQAFQQEGGIEVIFAYDGDSAVKLAVKRQPDLMLLDILMPGIDGLTVLKTLRELPETVNTKIIILTVLSNAELKDQARSLGVIDYIVKSDFPLPEIVKKVKQHLNIP